MQVPDGMEYSQGGGAIVRNRNVCQIAVCDIKCDIKCETHLVVGVVEGAISQ